MPKYYVKSGQIQFIIDCNDSESAILSALYHYKDKKIIRAKKICVSETGFIDNNKWECHDITKFDGKI